MREMSIIVLGVELEEPESRLKSEQIMTDERTAQINIPRKIVDQFADVAAGTPEDEPDEGNAPWEQGTFDDQVELTGGVTIVGTNEPDFGTSTETVDNYYLHELGHVLGAIHPKQDADESEFEVPPDEPGVMCKESCKVEAGTRITAESYINTVIGRGSPVANFNPDVDLPMNFADENEFRILNLDYDYMDRGPEPPNGENTDRNVTSVATAATDGSE